MPATHLPFIALVEALDPDGREWVAFASGSSHAWLREAMADALRDGYLDVRLTYLGQPVELPPAPTCATCGDTPEWCPEARA